MPIFRVIVTYPNAKVEEIDEDFNHYEEALAYANHLLGSVDANEQYHPDILDEEGEAKHVKPYAIITERIDNESRIVYDSRKK